MMKSNGMIEFSLNMKFAKKKTNNVLNNGQRKLI